MRLGADAFSWLLSLLLGAILLGLGWAIRSRLNHYAWYQHLTVALIIAAVVVPPLLGRGLNWIAILVAASMLIDAVISARRRPTTPPA